jgi:putative DNA primase/helicase
VDRAAEGTLKALVSGEPVTVEQKHCPVAAMRLTAKHLFVANSLPRFHDTSDGIWRRLTLIPFDRVCPPGRRDAGLKAKLRGELPGIAHWALQGLARLRSGGGFTPFEAGLQADGGGAEGVAGGRPGRLRRLPARPPGRRRPTH